MRVCCNFADSLCRPGLLMPGVSMFGAYQFPDVETRTLKVAALDLLVDDLEMDMAEAQRWAQALNFHHQWMVLAREHAAALVLLTKEIGVVSGAQVQRDKLAADRVGLQETCIAPGSCVLLNLSC